MWWLSFWPPTYCSCWCLGWRWNCTRQHPVRTSTNAPDSGSWWSSSASYAHFLAWAAFLQAPLACGSAWWNDWWALRKPRNRCMRQKILICPIDQRRKWPFNVSWRVVHTNYNEILESIHSPECTPELLHTRVTRADPDHVLNYFTSKCRSRRIY